MTRDRLPSDPDNEARWPTLTEQELEARARLADGHEAAALAGTGANGNDF